MKQFKKICSIALAISLTLSSSLAFADGSKYEKEENVYVITTPSGEVEKEIVSTWLHTTSGSIDVKQKSSLNNVKNIKGNDEITLSNGNIEFKTAVSDMYYRGTTNKTLPFEIEIKYFLDGKETPAEQMLGKFGKVRMEISFKNNMTKKVTLAGKEETLYLPIAIVGTINLPTDNFKNVKINHGKLMNDAKNQVISFVSAPGMSENFNFESDELMDTLNEIDSTIVIEADASEFSFESMMFIATNEIPNVAKIDDLDKVSEKVGEFKDSADELKEGTEKLSSGQSEFAAKLYQYLDGTTKLSQGSAKLNAAAQTLKEKAGALLGGFTQIKTGGEEFAKGVTAFSEGSSKFAQGSDQFAKGANEFAKGAAGVADGVSTLVTKSATLAEGAKKADAATKQLKTGIDTANQNFEQMATAIKNSQEEAATSLQAQVQAYNEMLKGTDGTIAALTSMNLEGQNKAVADALIANLKQQKAGLNQMINTSNSKLQAMANSDSATKLAALLGGYQKVAAGLGELSAATGQIADGTSKIATGSQSLAGAKEKLSGASKQLTAASDALLQGAAPLNEGAKKFSEGAAQYIAGLGQYDAGINQFYNQGITPFAVSMNEFGTGMTKLASNNQALKNGESLLVNGANEMNNSVANAMENNTENDSSKFVKDLEKISDIQEELKAFADDNMYFSENYEGAKQNVKYIIKIKGIK